MTTTTAKPARPAAASGRRFFHTYRFQISIITLLVVLYAVFIIRRPGTYLSFNIYRSFMISIPFFGLMAMAATFIVTLGEIDLSFPSIAGFSGWVFASTYVATDSFIIALCAVSGDRRPSRPDQRPARHQGRHSVDRGHHRDDVPVERPGQRGDRGPRHPDLADHRQSAAPALRRRAVRHHPGAVPLVRRRLDPDGRDLQAPPLRQPRAVHRRQCRKRAHDGHPRRPR